MTGVEQARGVRAGGVAVGRHHHALACGESVVLHHPRGVAGRRAEPVQRGVETCRVVDDFAAGGPHPGGVHDVLGEGLGALDAGRVLRRAEAGDPRRPHRVGHAEHERHLGTDHHQVGSELLGEGDHLRARGDVDVVLLGDGRGTRIARRDRHGRPPRGPGATPAAAHVHGHRIRSRGRARWSTLNLSIAGHTLDAHVYGLPRVTHHTERLSRSARGTTSPTPTSCSEGIPVTEFAELRRTAPVWWNEQESRSSTTAATG